MKHPNEVGGRLPRYGGTERRTNTRFPIIQDFRYTVRGSGPAENLGHLMNLSSSGLSFTADGPLAVGQCLDAAIDWPAKLEGGVQIELILSGVVVRTDGTAIALEIRRHEFKTRRVA
jgi:PilZ domain-containing protein